MTAAMWGLLAAALLAWPGPSPARVRWRALARSADRAPAHRGPRRGAARPFVGEAEALRAVRSVRAELAAGASPAQALAATARVEPGAATVLRAAAGAAAAAQDVSTVLAREPAMRGMAAAWGLVDAAGVPLTAALDGVAADLGRRIEQQQAVTTALAGPRAAAFVLAGLPGLGLLLAAGMGARPLDFLVGTSVGRLVAVAGLLLDGLGIAWTSHLARSAQRA
ncbi:MAG: type II secretion system protein [Jatrophihabitans sp.]|nr:MAG: type II secretion system protein [Jatrophihabitans sp.]